MTTQQGNPVFSPYGNLFTIQGRLLGGSGVVSVQGVARGWSVSYTSTGLYKVTADVNMAWWIGGGAPGIMSSGNALTARVKSYTGGDNAAGTALSWSILVTTISTGAATDLGASDQLFFHFDCGRTVRP